MFQTYICLYHIRSENGKLKRRLIKNIQIDLLHIKSRHNTNRLRSFFKLNETVSAKC